PQQIALLVRDIHQTLKVYALAGIGPWICYTYGPTSVRDLIYRGSPGRFSMLIALSNTHPEIELIQPLTGPSIYDEWFETHGEGLHHIAYTVDEINEAIADMKNIGFPVIQYGAGYGVDGDGAFAYFDTQAEFGTILEVRVIPRRRRPPEWTIEPGYSPQ